MSAKGNGHDDSMPVGGSGGRGITTVQAPVAGGDDDLELMTPEDVATLFKIPETWVRSQTRKRAKTPMPHFKCGMYTRFREADVRAWLNNQKRGYEPQPAKSRKR